MGFESIDQPGRSSEVERNTTMSISFFLAGERWWMGFKSINQPSQSSEFECNPKISISFFFFFWFERGGRWGSSPSTSPANHQNLNVIQKSAFHFFFFFFGLRGVADGAQVHRPAWPIIRS